MNEKEYLREKARLDFLSERASGCATTKEMLKKIKKSHRLTHFKAELMHELLLSEFDAIDFIVDMMHGMPINIAHILFKYSFLDVLTTTESREELAEMMVEIDTLFDTRLEADHGWMRASAMQAFECGSKKSPGLGPNIFRLCDIAYGREPPSAPPPAPPPPPSTAPPPPPPRAPPPKKKDDGPRRPTKHGRSSRPAPAPTATAAAAAAAASSTPPPPPAPAPLRPSDCDEELWSTLRTRYGEHARVVHQIMAAWGEYHVLSGLLSEPLEDTSAAGKQERARQVAHAAIAFAHRFEGVCNGRHKSWYLHLFVYVVPRQIAKYGELWPFSTSALELPSSQGVHASNGCGMCAGVATPRSPTSARCSGKSGSSSSSKLTVARLPSTSCACLLPKRTCSTPARGEEPHDSRRVGGSRG